MSQVAAVARRGLSAVVAAALAVVAASCNSIPTRTLDTTSAASRISSELKARYHVASVDVSCPGRVPARKGQVFVCSATLDGQRVRLDATVTDSSGAFTIDPIDAIVVPSAIATQLTQRIAARTGRTATVHCPAAAVVVVPVHRTLTCSATFAGQAPRHVVVTIIDRRGDFGFQLAPAR